MRGLRIAEQSRSRNDQTQSALMELDLVVLTQTQTKRRTRGPPEPFQHAVALAGKGVKAPPGPLLIPTASVVGSRTDRASPTRCRRAAVCHSRRSIVRHTGPGPRPQPRFNVPSEPQRRCRPHYSSQPSAWDAPGGRVAQLLAGCWLHNLPLWGRATGGANARTWMRVRCIAFTILTFTLPL